MKNIISIEFQAGQKKFLFMTLGLYDVSNLTQEGLIEFKKPFVDSYKRFKGISAATEWIR